MINNRKTDSLWVDDFPGRTLHESVECVNLGFVWFTRQNFPVYNAIKHGARTFSFWRGK
ncbi:hypothetical protein HMPREF1990_02248 [Porphyromonas gingivalis W4087]|nr:hypothetical protein HMPREF1990_02248 [Porphyromonas gingivalis W4087]